VGSRPGRIALARLVWGFRSSGARRAFSGDDLERELDGSRAGVSETQESEERRFSLGDETRLIGSAHATVDARDMPTESGPWDGPERSASRSIPTSTARSTRASSQSIRSSARGVGRARAKRP
jgi:hypothetical protein